MAESLFATITLFYSFFIFASITNDVHAISSDDFALSPDVPKIPQRPPWPHHRRLPHLPLHPRDDLVYFIDILISLMVFDFDLEILLSLHVLLEAVDVLLCGLCIDPELIKIWPGSSRQLQGKDW